jgi:hypothetical protein
VSFAPTICVAKNISLRHEMRDLLEMTRTNESRRLTMATPPKSNDFAFIVNRRPFPKPHLVHMSHMSRTRRETLDCFEPNVIHATLSMDFILKPLLHNEELFNFQRQVIKESMLEAITSNDKESCRVCCQTRDSKSSVWWCW